MKLIGLTGKYGSVIGNYAQVDDEDFEYLMQWRWLCKYDHTNYYACRSDGVLMHRKILNLKDSIIKIDHKDNNGLNNQRINLRTATYSQNGANRKARKNKSSIYLGVSKVTIRGKIFWTVTCRKNGHAYSTTRQTEIEAALWYNEKAKELHGEFAKLNIVKS